MVNLGVDESNAVRNWLISGGLTALTAATYTGLAWLTGMWPFIRLKENEYLPLQWFFDKPGRILKGPGTRFLIRPIEKLILNKEKEGEETVEKYAFLPAREQEQEMQSIDFNVSGLEGKLKLRYLCKFKNKKGAKRFYWDINKDPDIHKGLTKCDEYISNILLEEIARGNPDAQQEDASEDFLRYGWLQRSIDRLKDNGIEHLDASETLYDRFGLQLTDLSVAKIDFDPRSQEILSQRKLADQEAYATVKQAEATQQANAIYSRLAEQELEDLGIQRGTPEYAALKLARITEYQEMDNIQDAGRAGIQYLNRGESGFSSLLASIFSTRRGGENPQSTN